MAMAKAVVSTPIGAEGLPFLNDREICIAERSEDFAGAVIKLLTQRCIREAIGTEARRTVTSRHSWEAVVAQMEECLHRMIRKKERQISANLEFQTQRVSA
jgi:glycosyltransferase involved in cell wall biosynthesis